MRSLSLSFHLVLADRELSIQGGGGVSPNIKGRNCPITCRKCALDRCSVFTKKKWHVFKAVIWFSISLPHNFLKSTTFQLLKILFYIARYSAKTFIPTLPPASLSKTELEQLKLSLFAINQMQFGLNNMCVFYMKAEFSSFSFQLHVRKYNFHIPIIIIILGTWNLVTQ